MQAYKTPTKQQNTNKQTKKEKEKKEFKLMPFSNLISNTPLVINVDASKTSLNHKHFNINILCLHVKKILQNLKNCMTIIV